MAFQTKYPKLVKEIYLFPKDENPYRYDIEKQEFSEISLTKIYKKNLERQKIRKRKKFRIISPIVDVPSRKIVEEDKKLLSDHLQITAGNPAKLETIGNLIIQLDEETLKNQFLKNLNDNYFPMANMKLRLLQ